jgi:dihydroorotase
MKPILIKGGRLIDPAQAIDDEMDLLVVDGCVDRFGPSLSHKGADVYDARGKIVCPGLIDMHVHLREPGLEDEETIASGTAAAINGGFTTCCSMPNTDPVLDDEAGAEFVYRQAERAGMAWVFPVGAVTRGRQGVELAEIGQLSRGGAVAFTDDGFPVSNARVMRLAMNYTKMFDKPIISHSEDMSLSGSGVMNEGVVSTALGLPGIPAASEQICVSRDCILAEITGARLHIAHVSTAGAVEIVRRAKARGVNVTAETAPHYLALTDECIRTFDTNCKMNPPLRTAEDVAAVRQGIVDGTIDVLISDHAPHASQEKDVEFSLAPFGIVGMESELPIFVRELVTPGLLSWSQFIAKLTVNPARILRLPKGTLEVGACADVTIIDPDVVWTIRTKEFYSKSRNCPFDGWEVTGQAEAVIAGGRFKKRDGRLGYDLGA